MALAQTLSSLSKHMKLIMALKNIKMAVFSWGNGFCMPCHFKQNDDEDGKIKNYGWFLLISEPGQNVGHGNLSQSIMTALMSFQSTAKQDRPQRYSSMSDHTVCTICPPTAVSRHTKLYGDIKNSDAIPTISHQDLDRRMCRFGDFLFLWLSFHTFFNIVLLILWTSWLKQRMCAGEMLTFLLNFVKPLHFCIFIDFLLSLRYSKLTD